MFTRYDKKPVPTILSMPRGMWGSLTVWELMAPTTL